MHREITPGPDEDTLLQKKFGDMQNLKYVMHRLNIETQVH